MAEIHLVMRRGGRGEKEEPFLAYESQAEADQAADFSASLSPDAEARVVPVTYQHATTVPSNAATTPPATDPATQLRLECLRLAVARCGPDRDMDAIGIAKGYAQYIATGDAPNPFAVTRPADTTDDRASETLLAEQHAAAARGGRMA